MTQNPSTKKSEIVGLDKFLEEDVPVKISLSPGQVILAQIVSYNGKREYKGKNGDYQKLAFNVKVLSDNMGKYNDLSGELALPLNSFPVIRAGLQKGDTCVKVVRNNNFTDVAMFPLEMCMRGMA